MNQKRELHEVIDLILPHIPEGHELVQKLEKLKNDAAYTAPEGMSMRWIEGSHIFNETLTPPFEDWQRHIGAIWMGKDTAPPTPKLEPKIMKALSIRQPWASAIVHGPKRVENRDWATKYRGPILIHAAKTWSDDEAFSFIATSHEAGFEEERVKKFPDLQALPRGGIIGIAELVDCVESRPEDPWFFGTYGFVLEDVRPVRFVPYRGALGLFDVEGVVIEPEREVPGPCYERIYNDQW